MKAFFIILTVIFFPITYVAAQEALPEQVDKPEGDGGQPNSRSHKPEAVNTQSRPALPPDEIFKQNISLDLRNIDVLEAMKFLAGKTGLNIIASKNVTGRVTLTVENVAIKDVFDIMLRSNSLAYVTQGNICNVMSEAEYKSFYGSSFSDTRSVKVFRLKYAIPEQAFTLLDALKSEIGRVLVDPESGNVLIMDSPDRTIQMQKALDEFEKQNMVKVFSLQYAKAKEVEEILKTQLDSKKVGSVKADERNNQIIVQTFPRRMEEIATLIKSLDRQTKEVLIEAKVVKISLSNQLDSGAEWEGIFKVAKADGMNYVGANPFSVNQKSSDAWQSRKQFLDTTMTGSIGAYPFSGNTAEVSSSKKKTIGEEAHYGIIDDKRDFDALFKYVQTLGTTRVLSNPKIVVVNNQEAKIHIGERQAYVTSTTTAGSTGTNTISEDVTFVDIGIQLSVTPVINDDGYITMKVKPEISSVSSTLVTSQNNKIPIINTSLTETTVLMKDGTTLLIGGLRKEEKTSSGEQMPFLGKIPLLGFVFRNDTNKTERTEHLVMLTPHIISGNDMDVGNERAFGDKPGKEYQEYQPLALEYKDMYSVEPMVSGELPAGAIFKPYREDVDIDDSPELSMKPKIMSTSPVGRE